MSLAPGTRLGAYEVLALLGAGGMGEVYRARDTRLQGDAAIKVLPNLFANDHERMARFTREAQVLASLNHPHIGGIYGLEETDSVKALVLELVEGPTLADRIAQAPMPLDEALPIARQIAEALEAAHEQGIIHRDLKPANIKVRPDGTVKVLDFGLAKALDPASSSPAAAALSNSPTITTPAATRLGVILGAAAYMSPEQAKGKPVDKRSDIWAFGCVLYEMLTGKRAFEGEDVSDTLAFIIMKEPDWAALPANSPAPIRRLLRRCLEKDRKRRLADIADARLEIDESPRASDVAPVAAALPGTGRRERFAWTVAGLALVGLIGATAALVMSRPRVAEGVASQFVMPALEKTRFSASVNSQAVSPDGRRLVFVASNTDGTSLLWVRLLDLLTARPLADTEDATAPFWSPDSRSVGFFARGKLKKIEVAGGPAQVVADASTAGMSPAPGGTWNRDGVIVFAPNNLSGLYRVPAGGGAATPMTSLDQSRHEGGHAWPFFLPDGRHFLFLARAAPPENTGVYVGSLDSKEIKLVLRANSATTYSPPGYLLFLRESTLMAQPFDAARLSTTGDPVPVAERIGTGIRGVVGFAVSDSGTLVYRPAIAAQTQLVWVDRAGKPLAIAAPPATYNNIALSSDEKRVVFDRPQSSGAVSDVWLMDLERRITSRFTFQRSNVPIWSPDGRTVVFASSRSGALDVYQRPSNASSPDEPLLKLNAPPIVFPSDWSSDGRFLTYYRSDPKTQLDVWVLPLFGDRKPFPFLHSDFNESQGQFSPDGRWMAYMSDESGSPQIYVQSFPELTGKWQISTDGGSQPRWRRDGKELFYVSSDRKLMAVTVKSGATFEAEAPRALFETTLPAVANRQTYAVSADGQRFLLNAPLETESPLMTVVLNWTGLLKR